ncbi:MAG: biotin-independent malonate decarboxylase subunit gamma [Clostridiales bacterium]|nr:MAG: biotin-independent malonate decarboxylase subunit gamma [Clostridiales bacterium]
MEIQQGLIGKGREAIGIIADNDTFKENVIEDYSFDPEIGPGAVIGTVNINGEAATIIANDAMAINPKFPVVYFGIIGMEEANKMAMAVYYTIEADKEKPIEEKRPLILVVDTPGNGPGKVEEIIGMNKATGGYQLALAEARKKGHTVIAIVIGRAISGAFLCHGLQADNILSLSKEFQTMIHVMPLTSISRITKLDIERLEELSKVNPVFASGAEFFEKLGGVEEVVKKIEDMPETIIKHINEVREYKKAGQAEKTGPWGRGLLGDQRGGRVTRMSVIEKMNEEYEDVAEKYLKA